MHEDTPQKKRRLGAWRFTRRSAAVIVALLMVAAPAGASIIVQNFMEADINAAPPCFVKVAGDDASTSLADFDGTATDTHDGVNLLEEKIDLTGMIGDRVIYTDVVTYQNNCAEPINLMLTGAQANGTWTDISAEVWISNVVAPAAVDPNVDIAAPGDDWNDTHIDINAGSLDVTATGIVTVPPSSSVQGAFVVSTAAGYTAPATPPVLNWVAQATIG